MLATPCAHRRRHHLPTRSAHHASVYVRGEVVPVLRRLHNAVAEAWRRLQAATSRFRIRSELVWYTPARAPTSGGEETAPSTRWKAGAPARLYPLPRGGRLYGCPTASTTSKRSPVSHRSSLGGTGSGRCKREKSPGFTCIRCPPRHPPRPVRGAVGTPLARVARPRRRGARRAPAEVLGHWAARRPLLTDEHLDVPGLMRGGWPVDAGDQGAGDLRRDHLRGARGAAGPSSTSTNRVRGTPCREGTFWLDKIYERLETGRGSHEDIDKLLTFPDSILGKSFCALGDGGESGDVVDQALSRRVPGLHVERGGCPFDPRDLRSSRTEDA